MNYLDSESNLVLEGNEKQNLNQSYTDKYQKHAACSYGYKLVCDNEKFSKLFKSYLGEDAAYKFMIEENKYCSDVMKKHFDKELVKTKKDNKDFENATKCWICDNNYIDSDVKVKDHCHLEIVISMLNELTKFLSYFTT